MLSQRTVIMPNKMSLSVGIFVATATFAGVVAIAWRAGALSLPVLFVLLAIGVTLRVSSSRKEKEWVKRQSESTVRTQL